MEDTETEIDVIAEICEQFDTHNFDIGAVRRILAYLNDRYDLHFDKAAYEEAKAAREATEG